MVGETVLTVVGNLTADPELRCTRNGLAVANLMIASTPRAFDRQANAWKDGEALFLRASVQMAPLEFAMTPSQGRMLGHMLVDPTSTVFLRPESRGKL